MNLESFPTEFWHKLDDGRVQCDVCPRACKLSEGQRGLCFVRACEKGEIVLKTYGRSSGFVLFHREKAFIPFLSWISGPFFWDGRMQFIL